jgi:hypothetical protein
VAQYVVTGSKANVSSTLSDRVTLNAGLEELRLELPKVFLLQHSILFRAAFDSPMGFAEPTLKEMCLPEEKPQDFMLLVRYLLYRPVSFNHMDRPR